MSLDDLAVYLRLAPEFGGTRFGPFEVLTVRLGSDGERCHIVLPADLGVVSVHAELHRQGPSNLILAPAERTADIWLWKRGDRRPTQLATPTAIRPGDAFALVTANGPRFIVELDELPEEIKQEREQRRQKRAGTGRGRLSADSMGKEVKRQAWSRILVMGPMQIVQRAMVYIRSGAIYQPRNVILGLTIASGWIFGSVMMCRGRGTSHKLTTVTQKYESCQDDLAFAGDLGSDSTGYDFSELAGKITRSGRLGQALEQDNSLRNEVKRKARIILADPSSYDWLVEGRGRQASEFATWRERIDEADLDNDTKALAIWLAARPGRLRGDWGVLEDSLTEQMCGRGPLRMTWRQGVHLGLEVQPDAYYRGMASSLEDYEKREALLLSTMETLGMPLPEERIESTIAAVSQGTDNCLHIDGDDEREKVTRLVRALEQHLGPEGTAVPPLEARAVSAGRIAVYWATDMVDVDLSAREPGIAFERQAIVSAVLEGYESRGQWVLRKTAETIAQAVVVPCLARLNGKPDVNKTLFGGDENLPNPVDCLVLNWKLQNED